MHPAKTYELILSPLGDDKRSPKQTKDQLRAWLLNHDVESFVEGALDVDINHDYETSEREYYSANGGDEAPFSIYLYNKEELEMLQARIEKEFLEQVSCRIDIMDTEVWMEGWKESFKPFTTQKFYVRPPWDDYPAGTSEMDLIIEPGMAFGTGQHATTKICIGAIEDFLGSPEVTPESISMLDVGTGTGILAIAASKLGVKKIVGTDIEEDAIKASIENSKVNNTEINYELGSIPSGQKYDFVVANILAVVLRVLVKDIAAATNEGGSVLLSGLLNEEEAEIRAIAETYGLKFKKMTQLLDWTCMILEK
jgi:ribosomal protein L11 methyltransferase